MNKEFRSLKSKLFASSRFTVTVLLVDYIALRIISLYSRDFFLMDCLFKCNIFRVMSVRFIKDSVKQHIFIFLEG